jgi:hypothetical protein
MQQAVSVQMRQGGVPSPMQVTAQNHEDGLAIRFADHPSASSPVWGTTTDRNPSEPSKPRASVTACALYTMALDMADSFGVQVSTLHASNLGALLQLLLW